MKKVKMEAVLFLHSHYQTGQLQQITVLELSGNKIPISVIEYLESDEFLRSEDFDELTLDEPVSVLLTMEWEDSPPVGWYAEEIIIKKGTSDEPERTL